MAPKLSASSEAYETREEEARPAVPPVFTVRPGCRVERGCILDLIGTGSPGYPLNHAIFGYHCLHWHVMPRRYKICLLAFKSEANECALLKASAIKRFVIVTTAHANSIATTIESDDGQAHEIDVNSPNTVPSLYCGFPDAKTVLSKWGFPW